MQHPSISIYDTAPYYNPRYTEKALYCSEVHAPHYLYMQSRASSLTSPVNHVPPAPLASHDQSYYYPPASVYYPQYSTYVWNTGSNVIERPYEVQRAEQGPSESQTQECGPPYIVCATCSSQDDAVDSSSTLSTETHPLSLLMEPVNIDLNNHQEKAERSELVYHGWPLEPAGRIARQERLAEARHRRRGQATRESHRRSQMTATQRRKTRAEVRRQATRIAIIDLTEDEPAIKQESPDTEPEQLCWLGSGEIS